MICWKSFSRQEEGGRKGRAMKPYVCDVCGYVYNPGMGDPANGFDPDTPFEKLPETWNCPDCGVPKTSFSPQE
jgi:rubredoxin